MLLDAAIFDLDGLLVDSEKFSAQAFRDTAAEYGLEDKEELFLSLVGANEQTHTTRLAEELGHLTDSVAFRRDWTERYLASIAGGPIPLLEGVHELLSWLNNNDVKCAVATSSGTSAAHKKLTESGIRDYFQTVTCGDQVSNGKPHPEIYLQAGASIKADMSHSIGLEDSANGVRSAHAAGLHVIQVPNLVPPAEDLLELGHRICESLHDVLTMAEQNLIIPTR